MSVIQAEHLSKWYGQVIGINDVTLSIQPGVTGLLGPNGAGKSTLMHLMSGQLKPSQGRILLFGEPIWNHPHLYRRIGFCPDHDRFYESMTGFAFVFHLALLHGMSPTEARKRTLEALETVDMIGAKDQRIGAYSKGMRQRIKLAQALVHDPELLLLDEPLTGLDPLARRRVIGLIRELGDAGRTVIVSSHILHEIEAMTSRILLMNHGRVLAEGNVHAIRELIDAHPHHVSIRTPQARELAAIMVRWPDVVSVEIGDGGGSCVVETRRPDAFYPRLTECIVERSFEVTDLYSPDDNLEAVFRYLIDV